MVIDGRFKRKKSKSVDFNLNERNSGQVPRKKSIPLETSNPFDRIYSNIHVEKMLKLQSKLKSLKVLMTMSVHDMRNPANAIQFGVNETIQMLSNQKKKIESIKKMRQLRHQFINS